MIVGCYPIFFTVISVAVKPKIIVRLVCPIKELYLISSKEYTVQQVGKLPSSRASLFSYFYFMCTPKISEV